MENQKQTIILSIIQKSSELDLEIKKQLAKQISKMNNQELEAFLKSVQDVIKNGDIENKIAELQEAEKVGHNDFRQVFSDLSNKLFYHRTDEQTEIDKNKSEDVLNKIKSL